MAKNILIGQTVRINERYAEVINSKIGQDARKMQNQVGTEFVVTSVAPSSPPEGHLASFYVKGDPNGWGIWGDYLDVVPSKTGMTSDKATFTIQLDGTEHGVNFRRDDWFIVPLHPDIEDGLYVGVGNVYRVVDNEIRGTDASLTRPFVQSLYTRQNFANHVKAGSIRRVADSHGAWLL